MAKITNVFAHEILDSKGYPTIEVTLVDDKGQTATASCPSGTSVGKYEALELRDTDDLKHFHGLGVLRAINNIAVNISPKIIGLDPEKQKEIDTLLIELDGTPNKSILGANAILPVSIAVAKLGAMNQQAPLYAYLRTITGNANQITKLPVPVFNLINGGKHAGGNLDFQEFQIIPASFKTYHESLEIGFLVYLNLKTLLVQNQYPILVGEEGGFGPSFVTNEEALKYLAQSIGKSNLRLGYDVFCGLDVASDIFYEEKSYKIKDKQQKLSAKDLINVYLELIQKYHILYLEDPFAEDDINGWQMFYKEANKQTIVTGDDLTATNPMRLALALEKQTINGIIIKPNQIGTVIEAIAVSEMAKNAGLKINVSHRSGETNDTFIADFAVALDSDYVKFGAPARGERVAKYNRLLEIERELQLTPQ